MVSEEMATHEATHAVLAVRFGLPFEKVSAVPILIKTSDGRQAIIAAGIIGDMGGVEKSKEIRIVALAGCIGQVFHEWPRLIAAWERLKKPQQIQRDRIISRLFENKKDMQTYEMYSTGIETDIEENIDTAIANVTVCFSKIKLVARELSAKSVLSREEVVNILDSINFER